ncbi:MAG: cytochrome-c peroxidase [Planctomycetaceae bacterium]
MPAFHFRHLHWPQLPSSLVPFLAAALLWGQMLSGWALAELPVNLIRDPWFLLTGRTAKVSIIQPRQTLGLWKVDLGNVGLHIGDYATPGGAGNAVDLNGTRAGSMFQTLTLRPGATYRLSFLMSGDWSTFGTRPRTLSVRLGVERFQFTMTRPLNWSKADMKWELKSIDFLARAPQVSLRFSSDSTGIADGPVITQIVLTSENAPPGPLESIPVPLPATLGSYIASQPAAIALGKALFWDMQTGSDGRTACASCHWHAGADIRFKNVVHPGVAGSAFGPQSAAASTAATAAESQFRGVNSQLTAADFPTHRLQSPLLPGDIPGQTPAVNPVTYDNPEVIGSTGVVSRMFAGLVQGSSVDASDPEGDAIFQSAGVNVRQATGRNAPSVINAVYFDRTFWDGRANHSFNGVNPFGDLDPSARVWKASATGVPQPVSILLNNASLASQAVGPANSHVEMSWNGRTFPELGRKLLSLRPLADQQVAVDDSVLGVYRDASGRGLRAVDANYAALIRAAFLPAWWSATQPTPDGYTQMEANFSLFWGLSIMLYESTLVSNESPYDRFARGDATALSPRAKIGLGIALKQGGCVGCHAGPEFAGATISALRTGPQPGLIEAMPVGRGIAVYDIGFYNIGVRPTYEDLGIGAAHPQLGPLSYSRQELAGKNPDPWTAITLTQRVAVDGAFKAPSLRNVELTGPYMHHGGMKSLEEVVQFYARGSDFAIQNQENLDAGVAGVPILQGSTVAVADVVEFLKHLTDPRVRLQSAPFDHPELTLPHGFTMTASGETLDELFILPATGKSGGLPLGTFEEALQSSQLLPGAAQPVP